MIIIVFFLQNSSRVESVDVHGLPNPANSDEKESDAVLYDMLLDDFDEDDEADGSR